MDTNQTNNQVTQDNQQTNIQATQPVTLDTTTTTQETVTTKETTQKTNQETNQEPKKETVSEWKATGDETVDRIGKLTTVAGINPESLIEELLDNNNAFTEDTIKKLRDKHGNEVTDLLLKEVKELHNKNMEKIEADNQGVYNAITNVFGLDPEKGKEAWTELAQWTKGNLPETVTKELSVMLSNGGLMARLAAQEMANHYLEVNGGKKNSVSIKPDLERGNGNGGNKGFISKEEFLVKKRELEKKYGSNSQEVARLRNLRRQSMEAGY